MMYFKVHLVHYLYRCGRTPCPNFMRWWGDKITDLLSRMRPCRATGHQIGSY